LALKYMEQTALLTESHLLAIKEFVETGLVAV
jgi:hypothetical protein